MVVKQDLFEGRVEALKGYIYDCSDDKHAEQFKMTNEISGYVGREFWAGGDDVRHAVDNNNSDKKDKPLINLIYLIEVIALHPFPFPTSRSFIQRSILAISGITSFDR